MCRPTTSRLSLQNEFVRPRSATNCRYAKSANILKQTCIFLIILRIFLLQIQLHDVGPEDDHMVYNASIFWDAKEHPWMNLATIHLTALLPDDIIETTRFSVARLPEALSFPEATSVHDFNIVPDLRQEVYLQCQVRDISWKLRTFL